MSHVYHPSYVYVDTVDLHEACSFIYSPDSPVNEKLRDLGSPVGAASLGCAGIALVGTAVGGGAGFTIAAVVCAGTTIGCGIEGIIEESTPCGNVLAEVHVSYNPITTEPPVIVVPKCESGWLGATVEDVVRAAEEVGDDAVETGEELADDVSSGIDVAIDEGQDVVDDLADGAGDVVDEGSDIIDDALGSFSF